jgi:OmpA-OmpF porin, OOP family
MVVLGIAAGLCPALARAQTPPGFRVDGGPWRPTAALDGDALPWTESTLVPGHGRWNLGLLAEYVREPMTLALPGRAAEPFLRDQLWTTLSLQVGLGARWGLGVQLPMMLYQASGALPPGVGEPASTAVGDARLLLRWSTRAELDATAGRGATLTPAQVAQQTRERREGFGLSLQLAATVPLSDATSYATAGAPTVHAYGVFDYRLARLFGSISIGYRARFSEGWPSQPSLCLDPTSGACLFDRPLRDEITFAIAVRGPLEAMLAGVFLLAKPAWASAAVLSGYYASTYVTLVGSYDARDPFGGPTGTPMELGAGLQGVFGEFTVSAGAAFGLNPAPGASALRAVLSLQWAPRFLDDDRDGLRDDPAIDHCIGLREDFDGYQDDDGCPEDNDHDAIPDEEDRCPFVDEDEDGFEDEDGCPDPDNDNDGVLDAADQCPDEAAGEHPDPARAGCPDGDTDGDGVANSADQCPEAPRGALEDAARSGCPAPDGDHDGVPDALDRCPAEPAGEGAPAAQRGCPETDRDHDGVPDATDRCLEQPETLNGVTDDDGCPESPARPGAAIPGARARVRVEGASATSPGRVVLLEAVRFDARDEVTPASRPVVAQLAVALRAVARPGAEPVRVSVAASPPGATGAAMVDVPRAGRRRDAVLRALRALGVAEAQAVPGDVQMSDAPGAARGVLVLPPADPSGG